MYSDIVLNYIKAFIEKNDTKSFNIIRAFVDFYIFYFVWADNIPNQNQLKSHIKRISLTYHAVSTSQNMTVYMSVYSIANDNMFETFYSLHTYWL